MIAIPTRLVRLCDLRKVRVSHRRVTTSNSGLRTAWEWSAAQAGSPLPPWKATAMPLVKPEEPTGAYIDIIERGANTADGFIVPNEVRINGIPLLVPQGESIKVHEMSFSDTDVAKVTITLFARRIRVAAEGDL